MDYYTAFLTEDIPPNTFTTVFELYHVYKDIKTCAMQFVEEYCIVILGYELNRQILSDIDMEINTFQDVNAFIINNTPSNKLYSLRVKKIKCH
jgi:hypothetical protein